MAYCYPDFPSKAALKRALAAGHKVTVRDNTPFGQQPVESGNAFLEGPHYPKPHSWYAQVVVEQGLIVKVK